MATFNLYTANYLVMSHGSKTQPYQVNASNFLNFNQTTKISPIYVTVTNHLSITQKVPVRQAIINISISHHLKFNQQALKVIQVDVFDTFFPYQLPGPQTNIDYPQVSNELSFIQTATVVNSKPFSNSLTFSQTVTIQMKRNQSVSNMLNLQSFATAYLESQNFIAIPIPDPVEPPGDNGRCDD